MPNEKMRFIIFGLLLWKPYLQLVPFRGFLTVSLFQEGSQEVKVRGSHHLQKGGLKSKGCPSNCHFFLRASNTPPKKSPSPRPLVTYQLVGRGFVIFQWIFCFQKMKLPNERTLPPWKVDIGKSARSVFLGQWFFGRNWIQLPRPKMRVPERLRCSEEEHFCYRKREGEGKGGGWTADYGCFLKWWYPQNTPKWSFLAGEPMVDGYHHFRKHPDYRADYYRIL